MICIEDYEFSYDLFLAEQSLFEDGRGKGIYGQNSWYGLSWQ